jgi:DnaJ-class molecular chaperone
MRDKNAAREFKRRQMAALKEAEAKKFEEKTKTVKPVEPVKVSQVKKPVYSNHPMNKRKEPEKPETCAYCNGSGRHEGLFKTDLCASCSGCGFDISDPLKVIEYQAAQLKKGRSLYERLGKQYADLMNRYGAQRYKDEELLKAVRGNDLKGRLD